MKTSVCFAVLLVMSSTANLAHAERYLIDPSKAETLRCDDHSFKNDSYTLEGPAQEFVFTTADGETHHIIFQNHEECRAKINMVKHAQTEQSHPWVQIDTSPLTFAMVERPAASPANTSDTHGVREISSEGRRR